MLPGLMVECLGWWPGQGYCPPRVITRIHFASLAHWEFLLPLRELPDISHKLPGSLYYRGQKIQYDMKCGVRTFKKWCHFNLYNTLPLSVLKCRIISIGFERQLYQLQSGNIEYVFSFQKEKRMCVIWFWEAGGGSMCDIHEILPSG